MTLLTSLLSTRASFIMAALFVTWVAVLLLLLLVGHLHVRLQRLELANPAPRPGRPYSHLIGRRMQDLLGAAPLRQEPRLLLFLSSGCRTCHSLLRELASSSWATPTAIAWTDSLPAAPPELPSGAVLLPDGPGISAELRIRVTPFALLADENGQIVSAAPLNSLKGLGVAGQPSRHFQPGYS